MSRTLLLLLLVIPLHLVAQPSTDQINQTNPEQAADNDDNTANPEQELSPLELSRIVEQLESIATNLAPDEQAQTTQEQNQQATLSVGKRDLVQQTRMAVGTLIMAVAAVLALGISLWGIVLLLRNLRTTNVIMRQDKAWVCVGSMREPDVIKDDKGVAHCVNFNFPLTNSGKTPAIKCRIHKIEGEAPINDDEFKKALCKMREKNYSVIGPGGSNYILVSVSSGDMLALSRKEKSRYVYICCEYETIYGEIYLTEWYQQFTVDAPPKGLRAYSPAL